MVVGVHLNFRQRDEVRRAITDKICRIQPALAPSAYQINFHEVFQEGQPIHDLFVIEVVVPRSQTNLLYFSGANEVYVKTDAGEEERLSGLELQDEIVRRLESGLSRLSRFPARASGSFFRMAGRKTRLPHR